MSPATKPSRFSVDKPPQSALSTAAKPPLTTDSSAGSAPWLFAFTTVFAFDFGFDFAFAFKPISQP